jgi:uncharacterized circularly permuted ATP-grasp superfamily protein/uncharacterized alpha-E superfamily protein
MPPEGSPDPLEAARRRFAEQAPRESRRLRERLRRSLRDVAMAYAVDGSGPASDFSWELEHQPMVLAATEWLALAAGIKQRARLLNCLLRDLYTGQQALRQGMLPPELILGDPLYRRACLELEPARASPATALRFDLVRAVNGRWMLLDTYANTPIGLAFAVQNRRLLTQEAPEFYGALPDFHRVINFPLLLLEKLRRLSPRPAEQPHIVILTAGPSDPAYLEHAYLARKMGVPLAVGDDLLALDNKIYFKTIAGLERVDVIYRRLNDAHVDPVVFSTERSAAGIPGLLSCIRAGHVVVANSIGCGLAENRALEAYLPRLTRFYLGERLLLSAPVTLPCGDHDQLERLLDAPDDFALQPTHPSAEAPSRLEIRRGKLPPALRANPWAFVGRQRAELAPFWNPSGRRGSDLTARLSCFALCEGDDITVMPGGLVRLLPLNDQAAPAPWQVGRTVDAIMLRETAPQEAEEEPPAARARVVPLGSRAAENLFWTGRYAERAEATARMLSIVEDVSLEEFALLGRRGWLPVWRGMLEATGHGAFAKLGASELTADAAWRMTLDPTNPSSILSSVAGAHENARRMRDVFGPETWTLLNHLRGRTLDLAERARDDPEQRKRFATECINAALDGLAAFFGAAERTLLHDSGWRFLRLGMHLERAIMTLETAAETLAEAEQAARSSRREEADLTALVRLLSSQDAYRRTYQSRSEPLFVAELLLCNPEAPKSVRYCLDRIVRDLERILNPAEEEAPLRSALALRSQLATLPLETIFKQRAIGPRPAAPPPAPEPFDAFAQGPGEVASLAETLEQIRQALFGLHESVHGHCMSHQARLAPEPQSELPLS